MIKNQSLTLNFDLFEAATTRQVIYQEPNKEYLLSRLPRALLTLNLLEYARHTIRWPVFVSSLGRMPDLNAHVGGVSSSQHVLCEAVDWYPWGKPFKHDVQHAAAAVAKRFNDDCIMFGQLIFETRHTVEGARYWIHLSCGFPLRPLHKCRQVASITDGKFELAYQMPLDPWE